MRRAALFAGVLLAGACTACTSHSELRITAVGRFDFEGGASEDPRFVAEELSGLAAIDDSTFLAISDEHSVVHRLRIDVDRSTGAVLAATFTGRIPLAAPAQAGAPADGEGVIVDPAAGTMCVSFESAGPEIIGPAVARYGLEDGRLIDVVTTATAPGLRVFEAMRGNRGFESLTRAPDDGTLWTATEEALTCDGAGPSDSTGTIVRLQKLDAALNPLAQYAYEADPLAGRIVFPPMLRGSDVSGVADLLALPGGRLLVLERMFAAEPGGLPFNRIRIYEVGFDGATDVSQGDLAAGLAGHAFRPVRKRLLVEQVFPLSNSNFEGIALGPRLENGDYSLLLIADNHSGTQHALLAMRLAGVE